MHLLVLTEDFYPSVSGGAHAQWRFTQIAAERGHQITVVTPLRPDTKQSETVNGIEIIRPFPAHPPAFPPASPVSTVTRAVHSGALLAWMQWWARSRNFDAVYSASNTLHWVASAFGRQRDIPSLSFVGYTPSLRPEAQSKTRLKLERLNFTYGMADRVFCRVPKIRESIGEHSNSNVEIIHGILNEEKVRGAHAASQDDDIRSEHVDSDHRLLVAVGRLSEEKNMPGAVEILHELPQEYRLVIIGDGPEREAVEESVTEYGESNRVTLSGQLPHEETLATIAAADGLILPSHVEAYPTVVFEGLALGCTVFATPVGILNEVDHPRLHLAPFGELSRSIRETDFEGATELDEETLMTYSMARFADTILGAIEA